jgi:hypothetical protein
MSRAQRFPCRPLATVLALRRPLGMQDYRCGASSRTELLFSHLSSQNRAMQLEKNSD